MNGFEFLFSFYSLLLGLAVANVATAFADIWRGRKETVVGTATVLLGILILFSAAQQWMSFWRARDSLTIGPWQILVSMGVALPFVFISRAMLPRDQDAWQSLDDYYMAHSRVLLAVLLISPVASLSYNFAMGNFPNLWEAFYDAIRLGVPILLIVWQQRFVHTVGLLTLTLNMLIHLFR